MPGRSARRATLLQPDFQDAPYMAGEGGVFCREGQFSLARHTVRKRKNKVRPGRQDSTSKQSNTQYVQGDVMK